MTSEQDNELSTDNNNGTANDGTANDGTAHSDSADETDSAAGHSEPSASAENAAGDPATTSLTKKPVPRTKSARSERTRRVTTAAATTDANDVSGADETSAVFAPVPQPRSAGTSEAMPRLSTARQVPATTADSATARQISITFSARALWRLLVGVVVVAALVGVGSLGWLYYNDQQRLTAFDEAKDASAIFAQKLTSSMNADSVANMKDIVGPLTTGEYRKHLEAQLGDTTKAIQSINVKNTKIDVQKVSVSNFDTDHATTMVVVQVTGTSTLAPQGGTSLFMYTLTLDRVNGAWLVSNLDAMQAGVSGDGSGGSGVSQQAPNAETPAQTPAPAPGG